MCRIQGYWIKITLRFVNLSSAEPASERVPDTATNACKLHNEDRQKGHFDCKAFVNVSTEVISQLFE